MSQTQSAASSFQIPGQCPEPVVLISALNHYDYCPVRCYFLHVECVFEENRFTLEGSSLHRSVDLPGSVLRQGTRQYRAVELVSERLGVRGKADLVEVRGEEVVPVEFKRGRRGDWRNDALQLCAQALCLEEMLGLPPIAQAAIYYAATARRKVVVLDEDLRHKTVETIEAVRRLLVLRSKPRVHHHARCKGCSIERLCLPRETEALLRLTAQGGTADGG